MSKQIKTRCSIQGPSEDSSVYNTSVVVKCESSEPHDALDGIEVHNDMSLFSTKYAQEDTKVDVGDFLLGEDKKDNCKEEEQRKPNSIDKTKKEIFINIDNVLIHDKQIKTECFVQEPAAKPPLIYDPNITVKSEPLEPCDVLDKGKPMIDTLLKDDCSEDSYEDTKNGIDSVISKKDMKGKEQGNFDEVFIKSEPQAEELFEPEYNIADTENSSSNSELGCEDTSGNFANPRSVGVKKNNTSMNRAEQKKGLKLFRCEICEKCFTQSSSLNVHKRTHTSEKPFKCDVCDKCFSQRSNLNSHKFTHTGKKQYQCDVCNKCFTQSGSLSQHKRTHTGEKPYKCDVCDKSFSQTSNLNNHKLTHANEKQFECDICNKCFTQSGNLSKHKRTHMSEKLFKCDVCEMCFLRPSNLNCHKLTHTGERPYECNVCNKCFARSSQLDKHKRTHTGEKPFKCDVCDKRFAQVNNLNNHKLAHEDKKKYKCDVCSKCFAQPRSLSKHKLIHTGEKPFKCEVCEKCFTRSSNLICHKLTHTGGETF